MRLFSREHADSLLATALAARIEPSHISMFHHLQHGACAAAFLALAGLSAPACSTGGDDPPADASGAPDTVDARQLCYAGGGTPTPGAEVELGYASAGYAPLNEDDELTVFAGNQGGFHFFLHARIRGLSPGDPAQPLEVNPTTWFSVLTEDGTDITVQSCVYPLAYQQAADGAYVLPYPPLVQIETKRVPGIYGQRLRIKVEVKDAQGRYATDEAWIIAVPKFEPDAGAPDAGAPDAGVSDAGVPDADSSDASASAGS